MLQPLASTLDPMEFRTTIGPIKSTALSFDGGIQGASMNKFDAEMEIIIESIDSKLRLCGATLAGLLITSGCLIYIQAAKTIL